MPKKTASLLIFIFVCAFFVSLVLPVGAAGLLPDACTKSPADTNVNACGVSQMVETLINVTDFILGLTGSAALAMFVYGGVLWIIAAGNQDLIKKGKDAMIAAVIGLAIVLGSWLIINFTIAAVTGNANATIFGQPWYNEAGVCCQGLGTCFVSPTGQCPNGYTANGTACVGMTCY